VPGARAARQRYAVVREPVRVFPPDPPGSDSYFRLVNAPLFGYGLSIGQEGAESTTL